MGQGLPGDPWRRMERRGPGRADGRCAGAGEGPVGPGPGPGPSELGGPGIASSCEAAPRTGALPAHVGG